MKSFNLTDVFTPTKPATLTYVDRESITKRLEKSLITPGKQLVIYGYTGCGKTTFLTNKLSEYYENVIVTSCTKGISFNQIIINAFDELDQYYTTQIKSENKITITGQIKALFVKIKSEFENSQSLSQDRVVPIQLTPQRLAQFLGTIDCCWVIEDFHKVKDSEKADLAQMMKVFVDQAKIYDKVKIVCIGAVGSAREVVKLDKEMRNRVSEICVPLMHIKELESIIEKGEKLLNINFNQEIKNKITLYSSGLASTCHQLCFNMCIEKGLLKTSPKQINFTDKDLDKAIEVYLEDNSDSLKSTYEKATCIRRKSRYNNAVVILKAIIKSKKDEISYSDLLTQIRKINADYPRGNLTKYLEQLRTAKCDEILRFNSDSNLYSFSSPFLRAYCEIIFRDKRKNINITDIRISPTDIHAFLRAMDDISRDPDYLEKFREDFDL